MSTASRQPTRRALLRQLSRLAPAGWALNFVTAASAADGGPTGAQAKRLAGVKSWGYQLQKIDPAVIAKSPYDLLVIDYSRDGSDDARFTPEEVALMRRKPDGSPRIVLAYFSIGEAEDYRFYWNNTWVEPDADDKRGQEYAKAREKLEAEMERADASSDDKESERLDKELEELDDQAADIPRRVNSETAPAWLDEENEDWRSNFFVRYWDPGWQQLLFGNPQAMLDKIMASGFDGVYLDRVDIFYQYEEVRWSARDDIVALVGRIAEYARARKPGFLIMPQNGEELLLNPAYRAVIDGIAKEDLFYGTAAEPGDADAKPGKGRKGKRKPAVAAKGQANKGQAKKTEPAGAATAANTAKEVATSLNRLQDGHAAGVTVLVVEYFDARRKTTDWIADARRRITEAGFISYFGVRDLDQLVLPDQAVVATAPSAGRRRGNTRTASADKAGAKAHKRKRR